MHIHFFKLFMIFVNIFKRNEKKTQNLVHTSNRFELFKMSTFYNLYLVNSEYSNKIFEIQLMT